MLSKEQIIKKCIKLQSKYWKLYDYNNISNIKWNKAYQCVQFINKIYLNAK